MHITIRTQERHTYQIEVTPSMTFLEVKQKMEQISGAGVARQSLWLYGSEVRDDRDMEFYDIEDGATIILNYERVSLGYTFPIVAKTPTEELSVEVEEALTVAKLKERIQAIAKIPVEKMALFHFSREMEDALFLSAYFVTEDSKIEIKLLP
ncbi:PREDICTED: polyubiquitin-like [Nelumbo nucifera]|uniref:Ubiquitin-like domain-containing protein n=2 Tax=Nelumbo nucifera TaxID=4432 RepID=A0A822XJZ6_NELNU|nr:PREDICTED: polyubiquitin-like [Nelumbo nucifera]DAD19276.1 TPA_asm: hypothetical protein HUJ06_020739 [Nelumbo nucifera]